MITGASSGIGRGLAGELAKRRARTALIGRRTSVLDEIVGEIESRNGTAIAVAADVQDADAIRTAAARGCSAFGPIDVLIANAGVGAKTYAFPWQLASIVRAGMIMPNFMYDWIAARSSFRE